MRRFAISGASIRVCGDFARRCRRVGRLNRKTDPLRRPSASGADPPPSRFALSPRGGGCYTEGTSQARYPSDSLGRGFLESLKVFAARPSPRGRGGLTVPKLKTHRGAAKRFSLTGSGKVRRNHSKMNHILTKKTRKQKRRLRKSSLVSPAMHKTIKRMISPGA